MRIAVATDNGRVSPHFGRCPSYTIVEVQDGRVARRTEIANPGHSPGFLPGFLSEKGVEVIIAGGMGPRAQGLFEERNIRTIIGAEGPVDEVIDRFIKGALETGPSRCDHGARHGHGPCDQGQPLPTSGRAASAGEKVVVTAKGDDLDAEVDPRFGRAAYFILADPATGDFEAFANPFADDPHGAGIQAAQFVLEKSPAALLTGQVGPNAERVLSAAGVKVFSAGGTVRQALASLRRA